MTMEARWARVFMLANELEAIDIGDGNKPRPTYISAKLNPKYKQELTAL
jgi:hypothetical protein